MKKINKWTEEAREWRNKVYSHLKDIQDGKVPINNSHLPLFHNNPSKYRIPEYADEILF